MGGVLQSISVYIRGPLDIAGFRRYQVGIYSDNNGKPGTLIAKSVAGTLFANVWNTLPLVVPLQPSTAYWLAVNNNGQGAAGVQVMVYSDSIGGPGFYSVSGVPFGTWPVTFPSTITGGTFSLYMTVTKP